MSKTSLGIIPTLRWGILGTGWVSTRFAQDLVLQRADARARHQIQAIGTSSTQKAEKLIESLPKETSPDQPAVSIYTDYSELYRDPKVDIVYVGTPHALHKANCLEAIAAGKNVLCEKPLAINEQDAAEIVAAAEAKGVFLMEGVWTRFFPLILALRRLIHEEKAIGQVQRVFCDFSMPMNLELLPSNSRLKDVSLGAGALLDIGIYPLTYGLLTLNPDVGSKAVEPHIQSTLGLVGGIDHTASILLSYPNTPKIGVLTAAVNVKTDEQFCRIEGTEGVIKIFGFAASNPKTLVISKPGETDVVQEYVKPGMGFYYEADAVACNIAAGKKQNEILSWSESLRVLRLMDMIRRENGLRYPQDA